METFGCEWTVMECVLGPWACRWAFSLPKQMDPMLFVMDPSLFIK